jgi:hypothetical protein
MVALGESQASEQVEAEAAAAAADGVEARGDEFHSAVERMKSSLGPLSPGQLTRLKSNLTLPTLREDSPPPPTR